MSFASQDVFHVEHLPVPQLCRINRKANGGCRQAEPSFVRGSFHVEHFGW